MIHTTGCSAFLNILKDEGVEYIFGNPGTTELPLMDCLVEHPDIHYVLGLQEAVVMAMADGYSRASGRLSCTNFHVAPGLGNAIGAIYNANFFGSPVIVTAGQQERGLALTEPMLYHELVPMAGPVVKWATEVQRTADLPRVFRRAAKIALTPPTGPVFVSLPGDILKGSAEMDLGASTRIDSRTRPRDEILVHMADRLLASQHPVIIACHEVYSSDAFQEVATVAELLGAPVYNQSVPYLAVFPSGHPMFMGEITRNQKQVRKVLDAHDLLVMLGGDGLRMSVPSPVEPVPEGMAIIQVGTRDRDIGRNYAAAIAIEADVKVTLEALIPVLQHRQTRTQAKRAQQSREALQNVNWTAGRRRLIEVTQPRVHERPIHPDYLMLRIAEQIADDGVVVEEGISSTGNLLNFLSVSHRHRFYGLASGGIGCGIAAAVGVKLALPDRPLIAVIGDGSSLYGIQALWSAAHLNLRIVYVIVNNCGYNILRERIVAYDGQAAATGRIIGMDFKDPAIDFVQLAHALGVSAETVTDPEAIAPALEKALQTDGPALLDVHVRDMSRGST